MCLYPRLIKNKKYTPNKKNGGRPQWADDPRTLYVPVGCGACEECLKAKANGWKIRLYEELKNHKSAQFVTLTFNEESIRSITQRYGIAEDNEIATKAVRLFLERWRKQHGKSVRHWLVTELGHKGTERIHLHGIIFSDKPIEPVWTYGWIFKGTYVTKRTINYIVKYILKIDQEHKEFKPKVLCSKGIGSNYIDGYEGKRAKYNEESTKDTYRINGIDKVALPTYYRNKLYSDKEKEDLWINLINKKKRYVNGQEIDISTNTGISEYYKAREHAARLNIRKGYGSPYNYSEKEYEKTSELINNTYFSSEDIPQYKT